jgi:isopentenyl diphosphate isomerase/L-lactate dehydrogenase-like FMN-dependent dehydrogenase
LSLLRAELEVVMRQMGTPTLSDIKPSSLGRPGGRSNNEESVFPS